VLEDFDYQLNEIFLKILEEEEFSKEDDLVCSDIERQKALERLRFGDNYE
jgi:hypothetical protein